MKLLICISRFWLVLPVYILFISQPLWATDQSCNDIIGLDQSQKTAIEVIPYPGEALYEESWSENYPPLAEFQKPFDFTAVIQGEVTYATTESTSLVSLGHSNCHGQVFKNLKTQEVTALHVKGFLSPLQHLTISEFIPSDYAVIFLKGDRSPLADKHINEMKAKEFKVEIIEVPSGKTHWGFTYRSSEDNFYIDAQRSLYKFPGFGPNMQPLE